MNTPKCSGLTRIPAPSNTGDSLSRAWQRNVVIAAMSVGFVSMAGGCGSGFSEILFQAASAVSRSTLDVALTDIANNIADNIDNQANPTDGGDNGGGTPTDDGTGDGGTGNGGTGGGSTPPDGGDVSGGDATAGEALFMDNSCASCHCADATGGCALSAPALVGVSADQIQQHLVGDEPHPLKLDVTDQDIADLEAYFASLGG